MRSRSSKVRELWRPAYGNLAQMPREDAASPKAHGEAEHRDAKFHRHRSNKPVIVIECITTGWYSLGKYYNKIDDPGAYAAATLLHPNKCKAYLRAAWRPKCIKPGFRRADKL